MRIEIERCEPRGTLAAPPSKSEAHRAIICACLARGKSVISGLCFSEDICATADCVSRLGCAAEKAEKKITVTGNGGDVSAAGQLDCRESGSTLRFLLPLCLTGGKGAVFTGSERLFERPLGVYEEICEKQGITFEKGKNRVAVEGRLRSDEFEVDGNVSSQFISGLMLALPLSEGDSIIRIRPPFESRPYVFLTAQIMEKFGVKVLFEAENTVRIPGGQRYLPCDFTVGGDWSNAAYLLAFDGIRVTGVDENSTQGDRACREYFAQLKKGFCSINLSDCPDLAPILFAYAAAHDGGHFSGTNRLRFKESDRIACMKTELAKMGAQLKQESDGVTVTGKLHAPDALLCGHNDHRIVMALTYLLTRTGGVLNGAQAVAKSFPDYFDVIKKAGVNVKYEQENPI